MNMNNFALRMQGCASWTDHGSRVRMQKEPHPFILRKFPSLPDTTAIFAQSKSCRALPYSRMGWLRFTVFSLSSHLGKKKCKKDRTGATVLLYLQKLKISIFLETLIPSPSKYKDFRTWKSMNALFSLTAHLHGYADAACKWIRLADRCTKCILKTECPYPECKPVRSNVAANIVISTYYIFTLEYRLTFAI